jgi:Ca2+-binding RTX toxin-like protein/LysM repeat protein
MPDQNVIKEIVMDLSISLNASVLDKPLEIAQSELISAFKSAGDDVVSKLGSSMCIVTVTGARAITMGGVAVYNISVSIKTGEPEAVAKQIFTEGVGLIGGLGGGMLGAALVGTETGGLGIFFGEFAGGWLGSSGASWGAGIVWDNYISSTPVGQWSVSQIGGMMAGVKITQSSQASVTGYSLVNNLPNHNVPGMKVGVNPEGKAVAIKNTSHTIDPDVPDGPNTYPVKQGDSLWKIAITNGWDYQEIIAANPQITDPNYIRVGQKINGLAPVSTDNSFNLNVSPDPSATQGVANDPSNPANVNNSTLIHEATHTITGVGNVNTATGNEATANSIVSDGIRPGAGEVQSWSPTTWDTGGDVVNPNANSLLFGAQSNISSSSISNRIPVDPLLLDLNGDGVKLTSLGISPVLFDVDHDGKKELTGWTSAQDGIVVMDLNGNGKIDGIHETLSEYFNGAAGTNGDAGTKPYANGFAALKSLDSNGDNRFNSADTAWANVKVWIDADHDGETDSGELKTLAELGITSINLTSATQSGLVNGGNEILATGTFVQNGVTREAQAARFIANPVGNTSTTTGTGTIVSAEDGQSTYVSNITAGETIDVAQKGVLNAYGNIGNDNLIGDSHANWLAGGQGSDTFNAGAGDDVLIIDAADLQENIHAGDGFDMLQVVGSEGVTINLAQAEVEVAVGGTGDDVFIGGGRSSVFVQSGDGNDIIIGGAANDALSGQNGNDMIDGGAGNDVIRGGRGQDMLMGGAGDDIIEGGVDDDQISGGTGNDVLKGGQGDDAIDGGDGIDIAEFSGSFADYRITKLTDNSYRIVDTKTGRDGADTLTNIEKLNFADVSAVDITLDNPMPVKDVLTIADRVGTKLIKVLDLLANDRDWQGDALHITTISDLRGGTIVGTYNATTKEWTPTLTANGELQFTPDAAYTGVMSFKYKIADVDGTPGATVIQIGTSNAAEARGQVFIKTPDMPTDELFTDEWYLNDIGVLPVWRDAYGQGYTGQGVRRRRDLDMDECCKKDVKDLAA